MDKALLLVALVAALSPVARTQEEGAMVLQRGPGVFGGVMIRGKLGQHLLSRVVPLLPWGPGGEQEEAEPAPSLAEDSPLLLRHQDPLALLLDDLTGWRSGQWEKWQHPRLLTLRLLHGNPSSSTTPQGPLHTPDMSKAPSTSDQSSASTLGGGLGVAGAACLGVSIILVAALLLFSLRSRTSAPAEDDSLQTPLLKMSSGFYTPLQWSCQKRAS